MIDYLVQSGDQGQWMWKYWEYYFNKNYVDNSGMNVVFMYETVKPTFSNISLLRTGAGSWGQTIKEGLQQLKSDYVILTHEDYLIIDKIDYELLFAIENVMKFNNLSLVKIVGPWAGWTDERYPLEETSIIVNENNNLYLYPNEKAYIVSHQPSVWNRQFLISTIEDHYSPWQHELAGSNALRERNIPVHAYIGTPPIKIAEVATQGRIRKGCEHYLDTANGGQK